MGVTIKRRRISREMLELLKVLDVVTEGDRYAGGIARYLPDRHRQAIHNSLLALERRGLVSHRREPLAGRDNKIPQVFWSLTSAGREQIKKGR